MEKDDVLRHRPLYGFAIAALSCV